MALESVPRPTRLPDAARPPPARSRPGPFGRWLRAHPAVSVGTLVAILCTVVVSAALVIRQDATTTATAQASDVIFQSGSDYTTINAAGFATLSITDAGAAATLDTYGVPGAVSVSLGNVLKIKNQDLARAYTISLDNSAALNAAVTSFVVTVKNGATTLASWDVVDDAPAFADFTAPANTALDVSVLIVVAAGTANGSLGSFQLQLSATAQ